MVKYEYYPTDYTLTYIREILYVKPRPVNKKLLLVSTLSSLAHLLIIISFDYFLMQSNTKTPEIYRPISVQIIPAYITKMNTTKKDNHILKQQKVLNIPDLNISPLSAKSKNQLTEKNQTNAVSTSPKTAKQDISKIPANVLIQQVYNSIPPIVEKMYKQQENSKAYTVFDPELRKAMEQAYRKIEENPHNKTPSDIEVTGIYGDYIGVRINNQCWRVPVYNEHEPFSAKVWMVDFSCPKQHRKLFNNLNQ